MMDRREFLKGALALSGTAALVPVAHSAAGTLAYVRYYATNIGAPHWHVSVVRQAYPVEVLPEGRKESRVRRRRRLALARHWLQAAAVPQRCACLRFRQWRPRVGFTRKWPESIFSYEEKRAYPAKEFTSFLPEKKYASR